MRVRPKLERVYLDARAGPPRGAEIGFVEDEMPSLQREMPSLRFVLAPSSSGHLDGFALEADRWADDASFVAVDRDLARAGASELIVRGPRAGLVRIAGEVVTRCQRLVDRRNASSSSAVWDRVRLAHARLHDCAKPLVAADLDHAVDTWQWLLRLAPDASLAAQLAALFHDIERLESEPDRRIEQDAPDYAAFKDRHARRGAERAYEVLRDASVDEHVARRVRSVVATHERRGEDAEVDLINDADALSFFSLNSPGYADYFGPEQTRKKVAYTLRRLSRTARAKLEGVRLRADVRAHVIETENGRCGS